MKTVTVTFEIRDDNPFASEYDYMLPNDLEVAKGGFVVVDSPRNGYSVAKVVNIKDTVSSKATKMVVDVVDDAGYKGRLEAEKKRQDILRRLASIEKKVSEDQKYEFLAKASPEAADLLKQLKDLAA